MHVYNNYYKKFLVLIYKNEWKKQILTIKECKYVQEKI